MQEAVDVFGLSGLDRLFCFMIVQQLQHFLKYLTRCVCPCVPCSQKESKRERERERERERVLCLLLVCCSLCNAMNRSLLKTQDFVKALDAFGKSVKDPQVLIRKIKGEVTGPKQQVFRAVNISSFSSVADAQKVYGKIIQPCQRVWGPFLDCVMKVCMGCASHNFHIMNNVHLKIALVFASCVLVQYIDVPHLLYSFHTSQVHIVQLLR